jgi:hypothetical protein
VLISKRQRRSGSEQACPSSDLVTSSPAKEKQTRKIQKEHLDFQEIQWKSKYHLLIEELKLP